MNSESPNPHEHVKRFRDYNRDMKDGCDFLVVGSGPAGSVAALEMSRAGYDVVLLEEGHPVGPEDFVREGSRSMMRLMKEAGVRSTLGNIAMPTMQAVCLGGGSVINSAICIRAPEFVFKRWRDECGIDWASREELDPHYRKIADYWGVAPTPEDVQGRRNLLFKEACDNLGIESHPNDRNVQGCKACAECFTGCPTRAKKSTDVVFIPDAIRNGARVYANMRAEKLIIEGGRVAGIKARAADNWTRRTGHSLEVRAKCTILAAGVIGTPTLLQKNDNAANSSGMVGKNLIFHPGAAIMGIFDEEVNPWDGATQGYSSVEYLERGFKLESLWAPPAVLAVRFPDFGYKFKSHVANYKHMAPWVAVISGESRGEVRARKKGWDPRLKYHQSQRDADKIKEGLAKIAQLFEAAGAHSMLPGVHGLPAVMKTEGAAKKIMEAKLKPTDIVSAASHVFGTTKMGADPSNSVVDPSGKTHDLDDLYIVDTGIMPTCTSVNPMFTVMAMADKICQGLKERY